MCMYICMLQAMRRAKTGSSLGTVAEELENVKEEPELALGQDARIFYFIIIS